MIGKKLNFLVLYDGLITVESITHDETATEASNETGISTEQRTVDQNVTMSTAIGTTQINIISFLVKGNIIEQICIQWIRVSYTDPYEGYFPIFFSYFFIFLKNEPEYIDPSGHFVFL